MRLPGGSDGRRATLTCIVLIAVVTVFGGRTVCLTPSLQDEPAVIRIGGDNYFPPYEFVSETGVYRGFNVDLMNAVALELGINIELIPMPWSQVRQALENGLVDAIQGMKYSPERDVIYDFSTPYLTSSQSIFVRRERFDISDLSDLRGHAVAVQRGDISLDSLRRVGGARSVVFENQQAALEALIAGEVDAFLGNRLAGIYMTQRKMKTDEIKMVGEPIAPAPYCMAFRDGDRELVELFNRGLARVKKAGTYDRIYQKWFGEEIEPPTAFLKGLMRVLGALLGAAALVTLAVIYWNWTLRREVAARTRELSQVNKLQAMILENSFNAIVAIDAESLIVAANASAAEFCGVDVSDLIGRRWADSPLSRFIDSALVCGTLRTGTVHRDREVLADVGGSERVIRFNLGPLAREGGANGAILVFRDVTDTKRLEEVEATHDKMEAMAQVVSGVAHEIRNPLTSIKAFIDMLPSKYDVPGFREEISRHLPVEIDRLNEIVTDLMTYAKPRKPAREQFDVSSLVDSVLGVFQFEADRVGVSLRACVQPGLTVFADRNQIKQVLINLVLNAVEAMSGPGEVRVDAWTEDDDRVHLAVCDSGPGIAKEDLRRVVEPFFTRKPKGTGLGLSVSYKLVQENGGNLEISSLPGQGTSVTLTLPTRNTASERSAGV
ncbi:MAG: transporter substrate-binding domain-containing protein [Firmicutes bacterium]|nr:transporter substrate-binding domain-containing protein [Bacillota bacterium]